MPPKPLVRVRIQQPRAACARQMIRQIAPRQVLDMGCGSAILAMAASRLWPSCQTIAADNDPVAVRVARNRALNAIAPAKMRLAVSQGLAVALFATTRSMIWCLPIFWRGRYADGTRSCAAIGQRWVAYFVRYLNGQATAVEAAYRNSGFVCGTESGLALAQHHAAIGSRHNAAIMGWTVSQQYQTRAKRLETLRSAMAAADLMVGLLAARICIRAKKCRLAMNDCLFVRIY